MKEAASEFSVADAIEQARTGGLPCAPAIPLELPRFPYEEPSALHGAGDVGNAT